MAAHRRTRASVEGVRRRAAAVLVMVLVATVPVQVASTGVAGATGVDVINTYKNGIGALNGLDSLLGPAGFGDLGNSAFIPFLGDDLSQGTNPFAGVVTGFDTVFDSLVVDET